MERLVATQLNPIVSLNAKAGLRAISSSEEAMENEVVTSRRTILLGAAGLAAPRGLAQSLSMPPSMLRPGGPFTAYGKPAPAESGIGRIIAPPSNFDRVGTSRTPLHLLEGTIVPNGLHFERHHNGVPIIAGDQHRLIIHGMVRQPLSIDLEALHRYPMVSEFRFIECGGNSGGNIQPSPPQQSAGQIHGLLSGAQWTGVRLSTLLDEAGVAPGARWMIAEGADAAAMSRSIPLSKIMDDAMLALYQNGEALRPEQGYPMRLLLPGFEGNTQVKWVHRLKLVEGPANTRDETSHYTELQKDGLSRQFVLQLGVKSVILKPSFGMNLNGPGLYEISGLAWSGAGRVIRVEISVDGGARWHRAALDTPVLSKALTRFRYPWSWEGTPATILSRAWDQTGALQPTRKEWLKPFAAGQFYHFNGIQAWRITPNGKVANFYV